MQLMMQRVLWSALLAATSLTWQVAAAEGENNRALKFNPAIGQSNNSTKAPYGKQPAHGNMPPAAHHALLIGCSDYQHNCNATVDRPCQGPGCPNCHAVNAPGDLPGVQDDIEALAPALQQQGFQVQTLMNPT